MGGFLNRNGGSPITQAPQQPGGGSLFGGMKAVLGPQSQQPGGPGGPFAQMTSAPGLQGAPQQPGMPGYGPQQGGGNPFDQTMASLGGQSPGQPGGQGFQGMFGGQNPFAFLRGGL